MAANPTAQPGRSCDRAEISWANKDPISNSVTKGAWRPGLRDDERVSPFRRQRAQEGTRPQLRPIPAWSWMLAAVIAVAVTALVVTIWLLAIANHANPGTDQANARLDAVRTGLAAGAGAGAAVGLMLAFRRQHHQEITTAQTDHDATERRITELYTKAVEQLGSDKAPVRLGGLYALERLAQDNQAQRQTIVNVICAYLRMPFPPQAPTGMPAPNGTGNANEVSTGTMTNPGADDDAWQQEKQVRLTAQRILSEHLRKPGDNQQRAPVTSATRFWDQINLDLTGATLIDFDLADSMVTGDARFDGATFSGDAMFDGATFSGDAWFDGATFSGGAWFNGATFSGHARFDGATFSGDTMFDAATFSSDARFDDVTFNGARHDSPRQPSAARRVRRGDLQPAPPHSTGRTFDKRHSASGLGSTRRLQRRRPVSARRPSVSVVMFDGATFKNGGRFDEATFADRASSGGRPSAETPRSTRDLQRGAWFGGATFIGARCSTGRPSAAPPCSTSDLHRRLAQLHGVTFDLRSPDATRFGPWDGRLSDQGDVGPPDRPR